MRKTKISIVTVTYNAFDTLEDTILSVLSQTYDNIEFIVVDGDSKDGTVDLLKKYSKDIIWISEKDDGIYDAMNKGRIIASGDFLLFLGSDDILHSDNVIEHVVDFINDNNHVYYGDVIFKGSDIRYWGEFNKWKLGVGNISHQAIFYPKIIYKVNKYDDRYKIYADHAYNLFLLEIGVKFKYMPIIITDYAMDGVSATTKDFPFERQGGASPGGNTNAVTRTALLF